MASIKKRGDSWQALVARNGVRKSATFPTKTLAQAWAAELEGRLLAARRGDIPPGVTFRQLLERYRDEVVPRKEGAKWETDRINMILRTRQQAEANPRLSPGDPIADVLLAELDSVHVSEWRDRRLAAVQGASVNREWTILSHACTIAIKDWKWLKHNPFKEATRPAGNPPRTRRPEGDETPRLLAAMGCDPQVTPVTKTARVGFAYLFAIETGAREGEIAGLVWADVTGKVARLRKTKNGDERDIPLSNEARRLLALLPRLGDEERVFQLTARQIDTLFRAAKRKAAVEGLHFHDTRREGLTRLATPKSRGGKGIDAMTLAKISGHRDTRILLNTYYRPDMQDVATALD